MPLHADKFVVTVIVLSAHINQGVNTVNPLLVIMYCSSGTLHLEGSRLRFSYLRYVTRVSGVLICESTGKALTSSFSREINRQETEPTFLSSSPVFVTITSAGCPWSKVHSASNIYCFRHSYVTRPPLISPVTVTIMSLPCNLMCGKHCK